MSFFTYYVCVFCAYRAVSDVQLSGSPKCCTSNHRTFACTVKTGSGEGLPATQWFKYFKKSTDLPPHQTLAIPFRVTSIASPPVITWRTHFSHFGYFHKTFYISKLTQKSHEMKIIVQILGAKTVQITQFVQSISNTRYISRRLVTYNIRLILKQQSQNIQD